MNTFQVGLRTVARKLCGSSSIVAQRLKRTPSILNKLRKEQHMSLKRMQDIAGCRAIVGDVGDVYRIMEYYKQMDFSHELVNTKDYLMKPKASGYRGVHLIYKYKGSTKSAFDDQLIEIQLRTRLQHCWATAVETVDAMNQSAIKFGRGDAKWERFFTLMSAVFAIEEKTAAVPGVPDSPEQIITEAAALISELKVPDKLEKFGRLFNVPDALKKAEYYLMTLDPGTKELIVTGFSKQQTARATQRYEEEEEKTRNIPGVQVVLVSAGGVKALRRAYPNYYADTIAFVKQLWKVLEMDTKRLRLKNDLLEIELDVKEQKFKALKARNKDQG